MEPGMQPRFLKDFIFLMEYLHSNTAVLMLIVFHLITVLILLQLIVPINIFREN